MEPEKSTMEKANDKTNTEQELREDWQQEKSLTTCMEEMYEQGLWTDVKFRCKNNGEWETIQAHKIILAARSPVFQAMFFGPCADGKDEFELKNVEKDAFLLFLRYIYSDTVKLTEENALAVIEVAHCYQVSSLVKFCADYLATVISQNNACKILSFAVLYELSALRDMCCSLIDSHAQEVLKSEGFQEISEECLLHIIKGDTFFVEEEKILEAAERWSEKRISEHGMAGNGTNIRKVLGKSFYHLRFPLMTNKSLMEYASRKGYFSTEEYADIAGFINKLPNIKVSTNSCVPRLPPIIEVQVNAEDGDQVIKDIIAVSFKISASKDVALASIVPCEIKPHLRITENLYTKGNCRERFIAESPNGEQSRVRFPFEAFEDKVIKLRILDRGSLKNYYVTVLDPLKEVLPSDLNLSLTVNVSIKCLDFKQSFTLQQRENYFGKVTFSPPLELKRRSDPYLVEIKMKYNCGNEVQMKTRSSKSREIISNGTVTISERRASDSFNRPFAGIKSIGILNCSNRDKDTHPEVSETKGEANP